MPGIVMEQNNIGGRGPDLRDQMNGISSIPLNNGQPGNFTEAPNSLLHTNGIRHDNLHQNELSRNDKTGRSKMGLSEPPELEHITQGFFPFSKLVNRAVQQCWNDLSEMIAELAEIQISSQEPSNSLISTNGKPLGNQSPENVRKKLRALEFAQNKRGEFIKLLVLSQWSRQAADVSKLIDIQNFIRAQHQSFAGALQWMGDMKRDLVRAQIANPDLRTALEVLSKGEIVSMPDLGYRPSKALTPKSTLRKLRKINRIISARLALHDDIPLPFQTYRVHDGRVTFIVPGEFELDLSIGEEDIVSQFFFVDIRFLFNSSSSIPAGRMFSELDLKINDTLRTSGLNGCFNWLHGLVLTNKINILTKQAADLARGLWSNVLRIELLHRTLVLQYWASKPGTKSWLEIGVRRSDRTRGSSDHQSPSLGLRWMRDGQEVDSGDIEFDKDNLSAESLLRSVIALHISHILSSAFTLISEKELYSSGTLSLRALLAKTEPGDCQLDVQLTASRRLRVAIEPMSGAIILAATPNTLERVDTDRSVERPTIDEILSRVGRLRCAAAIEEVESKVKMLGFESISPRKVKVDPRRVFPANVLRFSFFGHRLWERDWVLAATSSMDGDNWWVVQATHADPLASSAQVICSTLLPVQDTGYSSLADLGHCLSGVLTIFANARFLEDLQVVKFFPPLERLKIGSGLQVPDLMVRYEASKLPQALQMALPSGFKKKTFIKDTVRLGFHGVDRHSNVSMVVVYGNLCTSSRAFSALISKEDHSLAFAKTGNGFALRLLASPGYPIILTLLESLQKLECVLSIHETLQRKKIETRALSLSRIGFAYGQNRDLSAQLDIGTSVSLPSTELDPVRLATKTDRLFQLRLHIQFSHLNPHRRIQGPLASNLNRPSADAGLDTMAELLSFTLPLMQALDKIVANPTKNEPLKLHVTVRTAKSFQLHYPLEDCRFQLMAHQHQGRPVWVLKDITGAQSATGESSLRQNLRDSLYNSKGDGWRGLGNGVVAEPDRVGNLLEHLDKCLATIRADLAAKSSDAKPAHEAPPVSNDQPQVKAQPKQSEGTQGQGNRNVPQKTGAAPQKADIIMID
ncbi:mediator complex subunit MED14-domain-containing protein [Aspergillus granulosus]|uniref:Mediator of RNA polymerase II transcription subunit 14 n=1 Tax=Aspergillus granulosus TaxID=176169 RepID=A0ABR4GUU7_9EURO